MGRGNTRFDQRNRNGVGLDGKDGIVRDMWVDRIELDGMEQGKWGQDGMRPTKSGVSRLWDLDVTAISSLYLVFAVLLRRSFCAMSP